MAIYVYKKADGALVSYCPDDSDPVADEAELAEKGLVAAKGLPPLDGSSAWDEAKLDVVARSTPSPRIIDAYQFLMRLTPQEFASVQDSADPGVRQFVKALELVGTIDLNGATTRQGISYVVARGLLSQARADQILA